jgi:transposase
MSQNNMNILYAGLDVAKLSLQLHLANRFSTFTNDLKGHTQLLKHLRAYPNVHVICEATGGYEQRIVRTLQAAGISVSILEAGRVRHFARAQGLRAKTDPIDAAVLSEYGQTFKPASTPPASPQQQQLADWSQRRQQLVHLTIIERNHAEHYADTFRCRQNRQLIRLLEKQIDQCDQAIAALIAQSPPLAHKASRLQAIPGVGPVIAATILAEMPELGTLNKQTAAALAGWLLIIRIAAPKKASVPLVVVAARSARLSTW